MNLPDCLAGKQVVLLVVAGDAKAAQIDEAGLSSLAVLRLMGLPGLQVLVQGQPGASLKDRSAAKKRAQAAVAAQVVSPDTNYDNVFSRASAS